MLTMSAIASGRILNNPEPNTDNHLLFIEEVCLTIEGLRGSDSSEIRLLEALKCVKLFFLGPPNKN